MRVLVTGGCGFLGSALAVRARRTGHEVLTLDRAPEADIVADIGESVAVADAIRTVRPDVAVHLAAALTDASAADVVAATRANALGTAALFAACAEQGVARIVFASSNAAVGPCPDGTGDDAALRPLSIYGATKAFGEHLARAMSEAGPTAFVVLRFGWVYGPGRVRGWRVAQALAERFARGESRIEYPDIPEPMDWTYVDDAAEVLVRALDCPVDRLAVCNVVGDRRTIGDAVAHMRTRFPNPIPVPLPAQAPPSGWGLRRDGIDALVGFTPVTSMEDGLDRLLAQLKL